MEAVEIEKLWGEELYNAFSNHINEDGWLTSNWAPILEDNFSNWDENYKDTNILSNLYSKMYNMDFEENEEEALIRPVKL